MKFVGMLLVFAAVTSSLFAGEVRAPELDGNSLASGLALVAGGAMILRGRRK